MQSYSVDIGLIRATGRLRATDDRQVQALMDSIGTLGLMNPLTVYAREIVHNGQTRAGFGLIAGAHRLEACKRLGMETVDVRLAELDELDRIIAECDENLCGTRLSPAEVAMFTAERKRAYEAKHPETAKGAAQAIGMHQKLGHNVSDKLAPTFTSDTAAKTGATQRQVQRQAERGEKVCAEALALLRGTRLDTGRYLDELKALSPGDQIARIRRDLHTPAPRPQRPAPPPAADDDVTERQVRALMSAWNAAGKPARDEFLARANLARELVTR